MDSFIIRLDLCPLVREASHTKRSFLFKFDREASVTVL